MANLLARSYAVDPDVILIDLENPSRDILEQMFDAFARLQTELERTKSALEERKIVERAKGILIKLKGLPEEHAYVLMRSTAMREKNKIADIAQSIMTSLDLLK